MKNKSIILLFVLILATCMCGCEGGADDSSSVVIKADSGTVCMDEARYYAYTRQASYEAYYIAYDSQIDWQEETKDGVTYEDEVKESVLNDLCRQLVVNSRCGQYNVGLSDADEQEAEDMSAEYFSSGSEELISAINITEDRLREVFKSRKLYENMCDAYMSDNNMEVSVEECAQISIAFCIIEDKEQGEAAAKKIVHDIKSGDSIEEAAGDRGYEVVYGNIGENNNDGSVLATAALSMTTGDSEWAADGDKYYVIYCSSDYDENATQEAYDEEVKSAREEAAELMYEMWKDEVEIKIYKGRWEEISFDKHIFELEDSAN